jgi:PAS domain S-box-containing protein
VLAVIVLNALTMNTLNPRHFETLKALTLSIAGIREMSPMDCRNLSFSIMKKTKLSVSETTIKRFFGFAKSKFNPSFYTLNAFAVYCGYEDWDGFLGSQPEEQLTDKTPVFNLFNDPLVLALLETSIPTIILKSNAPDFTIVAYNHAYQEATYSKKRDLQGVSLWEAFDPEKAGGYGPTLLLEAFHEAIYKQQTIQLKPLHYNIPSAVPNIDQLSWWDIKTVPVIYDGVVKYLLLNTYNITDKVLHQDAIEQAIMKELTMAEDLAATNIKLNLVIESLAESHKELTIAKKQLEEVNVNLEQHVFERTKNLFDSEAKQRKLIDNAPVAIAVLKGPDHVVETANKKIIDYWGKGNAVINKPLLEVIPELAGQSFIGILDEVRECGIPYINNELCAYLVYNGVYQPRYYDMIYQPIQYIRGITDMIFIVAVDITEHVLLRKNLEQSESMLRLAVNAAHIGIWSFNPSDRVLNYNSMFIKILGWDKDEPMTYEQAIGQVTNEFREKIVEVIESVIVNEGEYDFTYSSKRFNDGKIIWLRATGRITASESGGHNIFSGVIREIPHYDSKL